MVRAVSAFIDFFNSSGCEGITFGEMKHFLEEVLDSTLQELSNVKQLDQISSFDKLKGQARLRRHRCQGMTCLTSIDPYLTSFWPHSTSFDPQFTLFWPSFHLNLPSFDPLFTSFDPYLTFDLSILSFDLFLTLFDLNLTSIHRYSWWIKYSLCNFWSRAIEFITCSIHWWKFRVSDWFNLCWSWSRTNFEYFGSKTSSSIPKWRKTLFNWFGSIKFWPIKKPKYRPHSQVHQIMIVHELIRQNNDVTIIHPFSLKYSRVQFNLFVLQSLHLKWVIGFYFLECRT